MIDRDIFFSCGLTPKSFIKIPVSPQCIPEVCTEEEEETQFARQ